MQLHYKMADGHQEWLMTSFPLMHLHWQKPRINIEPLHFLHGSVGWMHLGWEFPKPSGEGERSTYRKWIAHQARFTHPDRCAQMVPGWCWRYSLHHLHLSSVRGEDNRWWLWPTKLGKSKINTLPWPYKSCTYLRFLPIITNSPSFSCDARPSLHQPPACPATPKHWCAIVCCISYNLRTFHSSSHDQAPRFLEKCRLSFPLPCWNLRMHCPLVFVYFQIDLSAPPQHDIQGAESEKKRLEIQRKIKVLSNIAAKSHHWASKAFKKPFHTTNRIAKPVSGCPLWWGQCLQHEWACITIPPGKVAKPRYQPLSTVRGGCGTWDSHGVRLPGTWQKRSGLNGFNGHTPDPKTRPKHPKTKATTWDWKSHYYRVWRNAPDSRLIVECDSEVNEVCNLQSEPLGQQTTVLR